MMVSFPYTTIKNPALKDYDHASEPVSYFSRALQTIISIFFIVAVIYFVWHFLMGAFHFIASEGDPKKIETAKNELTYAILGLAIVFLVFVILKLVGSVFGITGLNNLELVLPHI